MGNRRGIARGVRGLGARAAAEEGGDARSRRNVGLARLGGFGLPRGDGGDRRRAFAEDVREGFRSRLVRRGGRRNGRRRGAPRLVLQRGRHVRASRTIAVVHRLGPRLGEGQIGRAGVVIVDGAHIVEPRSCGTEIESIPSAPDFTFTATGVGATVSSIARRLSPHGAINPRHRDLVPSRVAAVVRRSYARSWLAYLN